MPGGETVVLGLGNVIMSDEGVGVMALRELLSDPRTPAEATLVDGGTLGLELLSYVANAHRLLLLDAVEVGQEPGTLVRFDLEALRALPGGASVHQLGAADLLAAMRLVGNDIADVVLLGVQPERVSLGTELSPVVAETLPRLASAALGELRRWAEAELPSGPVGLEED